MCYHSQLSGLDRSTNNWNLVHDFNWLASQEPSPNWLVLPEHQRTSFSEGCINNVLVWYILYVHIRVFECKSNIRQGSCSSILPAVRFCSIILFKLMSQNEKLINQHLFYPLYFSCGHARWPLIPIVIHSLQTVTCEWTILLVCYVQQRITTSICLKIGLTLISKWQTERKRKILVKLTSQLAKFCF